MEILFYIRRNEILHAIKRISLDHDIQKNIQN